MNWGCSVDENRTIGKAKEDLPLAQTKSLTGVLKGEGNEDVQFLIYRKKRNQALKKPFGLII